MTSVEWCDGAVRFIDQTLLPQEERYVDVVDVERVAEAIRSLRIRGAPAIGVAAALGVLLAARSAASRHVPDVRATVLEAIALLGATRPTAVNLFAALERMRRVSERFAGTDLAEYVRTLGDEALAIQREDREACDRIGANGAALLGAATTVLTHCNTGALATAGAGTALSVIVEAWRQGKVKEVYVDETRPLLQGARLTTWELQRAGVPAILITDNTAGVVMRLRGVGAVIVGADRIAANGDTANKVGTYSIAVLAEKHRIPFYVAAPTSTIDLSTPDGGGIAIEERHPSEVTRFAGVTIAPEGVRVFAPAFDVTPHELITAIVTERGVAARPFLSSLKTMTAGATGSPRSGQG